VAVPEPGAGTTPGIWSRSELHRIEQQLAYCVGPVAKHLLKRAAARARSQDELIQLLGSEIESEPARRNFIEFCRFARS
jgi:hypothetical protein